MRSRRPVVVILCVLASLLVAGILSANPAAGAETRAWAFDLQDEVGVAVERSLTLELELHPGCELAYDQLASDSLLAPRGTTPQQRGLESEQRVLNDLGETKNTQTLSTSQGNTIPDFQNSRQVGEIKDTQRVSNTSQIRAQREAAEASGREHVIVTGTNTKVGGSASTGSTIKRRDDLGPQGGGGG